MLAGFKYARIGFAADTLRFALGIRRKSDCTDLERFVSASRNIVNHELLHAFLRHFCGTRGRPVEVVIECDGNRVRLVAGAPC